MLMFGCVYYPWSTLAAYPVIQKMVLLNPLVYASEGLRSAIAPQMPHVSVSWSLLSLLLIDSGLLWAGLSRFRSRAIG
jgi:ABC-2 type transport system permease protein